MSGELHMEIWSGEAAPMAGWAGCVFDAASAVARAAVGGLLMRREAGGGELGEEESGLRVVVTCGEREFGPVSFTR